MTKRSEQLTDPRLEAAARKIAEIWSISCGESEFIWCREHPFDGCPCRKSAVAVLAAADAVDPLRGTLKAEI